MYGLVNKAIEDLALSVGGQPTWDAIVRRAGLDHLTFVSMHCYEDELTYRLVAAASVELDLPAEQVLERFGEHWVTYTGRQGYGPIMAAFGDTVGEFLENLNAMHARVRATMPDLRPPSFTSEATGPGRYRLHYRSQRAGLGAMVVGVLRGLGVMLGEQVEVTWVERVEDGAGHDVFDVLVVPVGAVPAAVGALPVTPA